MLFIKKIIKKLRVYLASFMFGIKGAETKALSSLGEDGGDIMSNILQDVSDKRVSKALLKGEVTQEVKELRYRTYKVDRESKKYEYFSPTLAKKRDKNDTKFVKYENSENLEVITIQYNNQIIETVEDGLKNIKDKNGRLIYTEPLKKYNIKIKRQTVARYKLEEFLKKVVVKNYGGSKALLDFYVSKYEDDKNRFSKGFINELKRISYKSANNDTIDIDDVSFVTNHAYNQDDMLEFEFNNLEFVKIVEYDGDYVLKFIADIVKNGNDITQKYYDEKMASKYKNKERKNVSLDFMNKIRTYTCEGCGKQIVYDAHCVDDLSPSPYIGGDSVEAGAKTNATEYMDAQITQQTYNKVLCKDCLKKYLDEIKHQNLQ